MNLRKSIVLGAAAAAAVTALWTTNLQSQPAGAAGDERVATVADLMVGVQKIHMAGLSRVAKVEPKDDKTWADARVSGAIMNETGFILEEAGRSKDDVWKKSTADLRAGGAGVAKAAEAKDYAALKENIAKVQSSCKACHDVHQNQ